MPDDPTLAIAQTVKTSLEAAALAVSDVNTVITSLNTARSVIITVGNNTSKNLSLLSTEHSHGGFAVSPPGVIAKQTTAVFGSQSTANSIATGTQGSATYEVEPGINFVVSWDNPFVGSNSSDQSLGGPNHGDYRGISTTGSGDQKANMRYDVFEIEMHGHRVIGAILEKWAEKGWAAGPLGFPETDEADTGDSAGRFNNFQGGAVYWRRDGDIGAHEVHGSIFARWNAIGRERFGYPVTDEIGARDDVGRFNHFRTFAADGRTFDSSIFWTPSTGAHEVFGAIRDKWASLGWNDGQLGYPLDAEAAASGGRIQHFQHGGIFFGKDGAVVV